MRKIIALGLLALPLSFLSSAVLAGNQDHLCDFLKDKANAFYVPGLYGLCTAYQNETDELAKADILAAFDEKAPDGLEMPGLEEEAAISCPCWDEIDLLDAACAHELTGPGIGFDGGMIQFFSYTSQCVYVNYYTAEITSRFTLSEESLTCQAGIDALVGGALLDLCDQL